MSPAVKLQRSQSIDLVRLLNRPGSTFMPDLMSGLGSSVQSVKRNARGTIQSTAQNPPGALRISTAFLFTFVTIPNGSNVPNTVYGRNIFPGQMAGVVSLRISAMRSPGWYAGCPERLLPCSKTLTGGQSETVSKPLPKRVLLHHGRI